MSEAEPTKTRNTLRQEMHAPDAYGVVMVAILATIGLVAVGGDHPEVRFVSILVCSATLLFLLYTTRAHPRTRRVALIVIGGLVVMALGAQLASDVVTEIKISRIIAAGMVLVAPVVIARRLISHPVVTFRTILGALCLYLLIGLFFSFVFALLGQVHPPFFAQPAAVNATSGDYVYFSYVTLATLGYGDLTPKYDMARLASVTCALVGQLYLVSIVALLIANLGKERKGRRGSAE